VLKTDGAGALGWTNTPTLTSLTLTGSTPITLSDTVFEDLQIPVAATIRPGVSDPTWTAYKGCYLLAFSGTADNIIYFTAQLPHSWKEGTDVHLHMHIVPEDNAAGNTRWVFTHSWANIDGTFPGATTPAAVIVATSTVTDKHSMIDLGSISGAGKTISSVLLCSLSRTGSHVDDTYNAKVIYLASLDFHYQKDTIGSATATTKA
jgi:hypothetical protein